MTVATKPPKGACIRKNHDERPHANPNGDHGAELPRSGHDATIQEEKHAGRGHGSPADAASKSWAQLPRIFAAATGLLVDDEAIVDRQAHENGGKSHTHGTEFMEERLT